MATARDKKMASKKRGGSADRGHEGGRGKGKVDILPGGMTTKEQHHLKWLAAEADRQQAAKAAAGMITGVKGGGVGGSGLEQREDNVDAVEYGVEFCTKVNGDVGDDDALHKMGETGGHVTQGKGVHAQGTEEMEGDKGEEDEVDAEDGDADKDEEGEEDEGGEDEDEEAEDDGGSDDNSEEEVAEDFVNLVDEGVDGTDGEKVNKCKWGEDGKGNKESRQCGKGRGGGQGKGVGKGEGVDEMQGGIAGTRRLQRVRQ
ncbi:unnamed protein product [Closterium sp. NIES-53]